MMIMMLMICLVEREGILSRTKWEEFEDNYRFQQPLRPHGSPSPLISPSLAGGYACSFTTFAENGNLIRSLAS